MNEEKKHTQTSLAGEDLNEEENLRQAKKADLQKKYSIMSLTLIGVIVVSILSYLFMAQKCLIFGHKWQTATCTTAKTCSVCVAVEGTPLGHDWETATCTEPQLCTRCQTTEGNPLGHSWKNATCTAPKTCDTCGATEGAMLNHIWLEATCTQPARCESCDVTLGEPLGHIWKPATFTTARTCIVCNCTEGDPIDYHAISVESEVLSIREIYKTLVSNKSAGYYRKETLRKGVDAYYDSDGELACAIVYRGTDGIGQYSKLYSRSYYFSDGELIFAFYEGSDSHRLYFYDELLMRWRYTGNGAKAINHDFDFSEEYYLWENLALTEISTFVDQDEGIPSSRTDTIVDGTENVNIFDILPSEFIFSSGVGAWSTDLKIKSDGTFTGLFHDSDMGDMDTDYPNGTVYTCSFSGKFTKPKKISEYIYSMNIEWLDSEDTPGTIYYEDGFRIIMSTPYGMDNADEFQIYLPGAATADLPGDFLSWLYMNYEVQDTLPVGFYGIYNVGGKEAFFGESESVR